MIFQSNCLSNSVFLALFSVGITCANPHATKSNVVQGSQWWENANFSFSSLSSMEVDRYIPSNQIKLQTLFRFF